MYDRGVQKESKNWLVVTYLLFQFLVVLIMFFIEISEPGQIDQEWGTIRFCGYAKAAVTLLKYSPQVRLNYRRKSTVGFSITNVLLDFSGGLLSFMQIIVQTVI